MAFEHSHGMVTRLSCAWHCSAMCGCWVGEEVPVLFPTLLHPSLPCFFCPSARRHAYAGISRWEEEDLLSARSYLCAGENPPPALTIDEEHGHFRITPYTLISGGFSTTEILCSESLTLLLLCIWTEKDFFLLLARGGEVRRRKSLGGQVTGGKRAGEGLQMPDVRVHKVVRTQPAMFL